MEKESHASPLPDTQPGVTPDLEHEDASLEPVENDPLVPFASGDGETDAGTIFVPQRAEKPKITYPRIRKKDAEAGEKWRRERKTIKAFDGYLMRQLSSSQKEPPTVAQLKELQPQFEAMRDASPLNVKKWLDELALPRLARVEEEEHVFHLQHPDFVGERRTTILHYRKIVQLLEQWLAEEHADTAVTATETQSMPPPMPSRDE